MNYEMETLLLNMLFILLPLFVYQVFWVDKDRVQSGRNKIVFTALLALSVILCMSFPIPFTDRFLFDLRQIPFMIGSLYGGYFTGGLLFLSIIGYRFLIGGAGVYVNFIVITLIASCIPLIHKKYKKLSLNKKIGLSVLLAEISAILTIALSRFFTSTPLRYNELSLHYFILQGLSMALVVYLTETMLNNYRMRKELIKAEKMNVVSQIAASISHEVKNPITITQGFIEALEEEDDKNNRKEFVQYALEELDRAKNIINEFLTLTKPGHDSIEIVNVSHEIGYAVNLMKPYAKNYQVQIEITELEEDCYITGDRHKIRQCLINLLKNSIEAMENGGVLRIKALNQTNKVFIDIVDTGVGMTPDEISRLGTPYYSTKEKGTGLGMMVVMGAIKNMNGEIQIESAKGMGTHFIISFPYAA